MSACWIFLKLSVMVFCPFQAFKTTIPTKNLITFFLSAFWLLSLSQNAAERMYIPRLALNSLCNCIVGRWLEIWKWCHFGTKNQNEPLSANAVGFFFRPQSSNRALGANSISVYLFPESECMFLSSIPWK